MTRSTANQLENGGVQPWRSRCIKNTRSESLSCTSPPPLPPSNCLQIHKDSLADAREAKLDHSLILPFFWSITHKDC
jgi:hypothetical protein